MVVPPQLVSVRALGVEGAVRVRAGASLPLQCRVLGARPPPALEWRLNDEQLINLEQNTTVCEILDFLCYFTYHYEELHLKLSFFFWDFSFGTV